MYIETQLELGDLGYRDALVAGSVLREEPGQYVATIIKVSIDFGDGVAFDATKYVTERCRVLIEERLVNKFIAAEAREELKPVYDWDREGA